MVSRWGEPWVCPENFYHSSIDGLPRQCNSPGTRPQKEDIQLQVVWGNWFWSHVSTGSKVTLLKVMKHCTWNSTLSPCIGGLFKVSWCFKGMPQPWAYEPCTQLPSNRKHLRVVFVNELPTLSPASSEHFPGTQEVLACKILSWCIGEHIGFTYLFLFLNSLKCKSERSTIEAGSETFISWKVIGKSEFHLWQIGCLVYGYKVPFINISRQGLYVIHSYKFLGRITC